MSVKTYKKKPWEIQAIQLTEENTTEVENFLNSGRVLAWTTKDGIWIHTLSGDHFAKVGDYIIKGVQGEFYPCDSDTFASTWEEVVNGTSE